nr:MAG TPA: hypothetical protein [Caudoviricetes sp.]
MLLAAYPYIRIRCKFSPPYVPVHSSVPSSVQVHAIKQVFYHTT